MGAFLNFNIVHWNIPKFKKVTAFQKGAMVMWPDSQIPAFLGGGQIQPGLRTSWLHFSKAALRQILESLVFHPYSQQEPQEHWGGHPHKDNHDFTNL